MTDNNNYNSNFHDALNKSNNGSPQGGVPTPPPNPFHNGSGQAPQNPYNSYQQTPQSPYSVPNAQYAPQGLNNGQTNLMAIGSVIAAGLGLITYLFVNWLVGGLLTIAGIVLGHIARRQIKRTGEKGNGLALTGLISSYVILIGSIALFLLLVVFIGAVAISATSL